MKPLLENLFPRFLNKFSFFTFSFFPILNFYLMNSHVTFLFFEDFIRLLSLLFYQLLFLLFLCSDVIIMQNEEYDVIVIGGGILSLRYEGEESRILHEEFDLVVLSVGLEAQIGRASCRERV